VDLSTDEFYHKLVSSSSLPTTSAPSTGELVEIYNKLADETNEVASIHASTKLSATYEAALRAKEQVKKSCRVEVIDSMFVIMGQGLIVIQAAKAAKEGKNLDQITAMVKETIPRTHTRMAFDTLEYLRRGGRIGRAQALTGSLLKVNPIAGIKDGEVYPFARERSRAKAIEWLYNFVRGFSHIEALAVEYATTPDEAGALAQRLDPIFPRDRIYLSKVGSVVGTHVGPHVIAVNLIEGKES
jgi:DegV family protein with EDD domain